MNFALPRLCVLLVCFAGVLAPLRSSAATIYLCKQYAGDSQFWTSQPCSQRSAMMVKSFEVQTGRPFEQQVQEAQRMLNEQARQVPAQPAAAAGIQSKPVSGSEKECDAHARRLKELDQIERQVRPSMSYDSIAREREVRLQRASALRCAQRMQ